MTKEELKNEVEEIVNKKLCSEMMCYNHCSFNSPKHHRCGEWHRCYESAKEVAEPREKRIEELTEQNTSLLTSVENLNKSVQELEDKLANADYQLEGRDNEITELEAQIEKMKSDVKQLREDRMNDDTDQNVMDRLWEEWTVNFGVSN